MEHLQIQSGEFRGLEQAINPVGESRPDWLITCQIAQKIGAEGFEFKNASEIYNEISEIAPIFGGINYQ